MSEKQGGQSTSARSETPIARNEEQVSAGTKNRSLFAVNSTFRRIRSDTSAVLSLFGLAAIIAFCLFGPLVVPHSPADVSLGRTLEGPSTLHWLGTDNLGRDMAARLVDGGRLSLIAAIWATATALSLGLPLGLAAGYAGGTLDNALMRLNDTLMSFPPLILAISIVGFLGPSLRNAMLAIGVVYAPRFARIVRAATLAVREETYIDAARALGIPEWRIVTHHVLPNILSPLIVQITLTLGLSMLAEAGLSFIGLGSEPPRSSWGGILGSQLRFMDQAPLNVLLPGFLITLTVLCFQLLGDGLRDSLGRENRGRAK